MAFLFSNCHPNHNSAAPACHCVWRRTGWCAAFWRPWRCPASDWRRRSCCSDRARTWPSTTPGTGMSGIGLNRSEQIRRNSARKIRTHTHTSYIICEHNPKLPDLVLDIDGGHPEDTEVYFLVNHVKRMSEYESVCVVILYQVNMELSGSCFFSCVIALTSSDAKSIPSSSAILSLP